MSTVYACFFLQIELHTADVIYFGALKPCEKCKTGKFLFDNSSYKCQGDLSDFAKCNNQSKEPARSIVEIPKQIQDKHGFLKGKMNIKIRATKIIPSNTL